MLPAILFGNPFCAALRVLEWTTNERITIPRCLIGILDQWPSSPAFSVSQCGLQTSVFIVVERHYGGRGISARSRIYVHHLRPRSPTTMLILRGRLVVSPFCSNSAVPLQTTPIQQGREVPLPRRRRSYDMFTVPDPSFLLKDKIGDMYFCNLCCFAIWAVQRATKPGLNVGERSGAFLLTTPAGEEHCFVGNGDVARWVTALALRKVPKRT